ncbi:MAG TPA: acyltransferase family protein [Candidatus Sulfotelmatobacter sp.]|jgi:fucose 4-O-acetylase-like acetyltransferase|nr:acyltransferase family protein [Candidatus Sulfotelmatobacter sp.]
MPANAGSRNDFIDCLRGALIFMTLWGHAIQYIGYGGDVTRYYDDPIFKAFYMFHMPLFMLLSGYLSQHSMAGADWAGYLRKRFRQILLPAICWPLLALSLVLIWQLCQQPAAGWQGVSDTVRHFRPGLWFLWALFGSTLVVAILKKFKLDRLEYFALATALFLLAPDGACIYLFKYTFPFFCLGYALAGQGQIRLPARVPWTVWVFLCAAVAAGYFLWNVDTYIYTTRMRLAGNWHNVLLRWLINGLASALFTLVAFTIYRYKKSPLLAEWGRRSLDIYIIQDFLLKGLMTYAGPWKNSIAFSLLAAPAYAAGLCFAACLIGSGIRQIPVMKTLLLGK